MSKIIIEGSKILCPEDFHRQIAAALDFGPYYGENLAALWDRLSVDVVRPVRLEWRDSAISSKNLGDHFEKIVQVLRDTEEFDKKAGFEDTFEFVLQ